MNGPTIPTHVKAHVRDSIAHTKPDAAQWLLSKQAQFVFSVTTTDEPLSVIECWRVEDEIALLILSEDGWKLCAEVDLW